MNLSDEARLSMAATTLLHLQRLIAIRLERLAAQGAIVDDDWQYKLGPAQRATRVALGINDLMHRYCDLESTASETFADIWLTDLNPAQTLGEQS